MKFADPLGLTKTRRYRAPLRLILDQGQVHWNHQGMPPEIRRAFEKVLLCGTIALGAELYASDTDERLVFHTCKSRACPSCGYRATVQWQRERWAALPDVPYKGITFTMPKQFWQLFQENRSLAHALPAISAAIMQGAMRAKHGISIGVTAILHTFNGRLEFNSHVHTIVTAGGLHEMSTKWVSQIFYDRDLLMRLWRAGIIKAIRSAHRAGRLVTGLSRLQLEEMLSFWEQRWWSVKIQSFPSREHYLRYAGRYVSRPPIAQRRITRVEEGNVEFWLKDKKQGSITRQEYTLEQFIALWMQHLPSRYQHSIRHFGLFAPRSVNQALAAIFILTRQRRRQKPRQRRWADSIKRDFGWNPLLDSNGRRMRWVGSFQLQPCKRPPSLKCLPV